MDFRLNEDQRALQSAAKDFLSKEVSSTVVRTAFESPDGDSPELYKKMAELGWLGLGAPEDMGGLGMTTIEHAVVCEQLGYVNAPGPFFSTACVAIPMLVGLGASDLVGSLLDGSTRATAFRNAQFVVDGQLAEGFLDCSGPVAKWFEQSEVDVTPHTSVDGTRRLATVEVKGAGRELGASKDIDMSMEVGPARGADVAAVLLCAEMVGGMQWALDTTVQYVKDREAFGRPIGVFQAVQHKCADMLVQTESARSAAYYAAYAIANELPDATFAVSVAKAYCNDAAHYVTGECIQLHGGIGFTWEHDAHLYFKRATTNRVLLGDSAMHRERALRLDPARRDG